MDVLIVESLDVDVLAWLSDRHAVRVAPELAQDPHGFRKALARVRAVVVPPAVAVDAPALQGAALLRIVARLAGGADNIDIEACAGAGVEVVRPASASAVAEAEFAIGALVQMLRRVPIVNNEGLLVGRELGACTVGIVGMTPTLKPLAGLLDAFGAEVLGYDPGLHASDEAWARAGVEPVGLIDLMQRSDAVCVLLTYFPRYAGLFGERVLSEARPDQVVLNLGQSALFSELALARALSARGALAAAWFDSIEPGLLDPGRPLRNVDTLQTTPRVAGTTRQSRTRAAWAVARRIDEVLLAPVGSSSEFRPAPPGEPAGPAADPAPA